MSYSRDEFAHHLSTVLLPNTLALWGQTVYVCVHAENVNYDAVVVRLSSCTIMEGYLKFNSFKLYLKFEGTEVMYSSKLVS